MNWTIWEFGNTSSTLSWCQFFFFFFHFCRFANLQGARGSSLLGPIVPKLICVVCVINPEKCTRLVNYARAIFFSSNNYNYRSRNLGGAFCFIKSQDIQVHSRCAHETRCNFNWTSQMTLFVIFFYRGRIQRAEDRRLARREYSLRPVDSRFSSAYNKNRCLLGTTQTSMFLDDLHSTENKFAWLSTKR